MRHLEKEHRSEDRSEYATIGCLLALCFIPVGYGCGPVSEGTPPDAELPTLTIQQDLRIDGYEEDLVPINWMGVSGEGRIALLQWQDHTVRFFDASGGSLGSVGQQGEGPGEFQRPLRAGWIADTLWVSDPQLDRVVVISPELEVVRTARNHEVVRPVPSDTSGIGSFGRPSPYAMFGDGSSLVWAIQPVEEGSRARLGGSPVLHVSNEGYIQALAAVIPSAEGSAIRMELAGGGVMSFSIPHAPRRYWTVSPNGSVIAMLSHDVMAQPDPTYRVSVTDASGGVVFDRSYPFEPEPIPAAVMDSAIVRAASRADGSLRAAVESKLRAAAPSLYPEAVRLVIGSDERIWVGMRSRPEGRRWRVLSPAGDPEAEVLLPPGVTLWAADRQHLWCAEEDELGVESVVRYRIEPALSQ